MDELLAQTLDAFEKERTKNSEVCDEVLVEDILRALEEEAALTKND